MYLNKPLLISLTNVFSYFILNSNNHREEQYAVLGGEREEGLAIFLGFDITKKWRTVYSEIIFK